MKKQQIVPIRTYRFQYGILHLELSQVKDRTNEDIAEDYGVGKGPLLESWDDVMSARELAELEDFREL